MQVTVSNAAGGLTDVVSIDVSASPSTAAAGETVVWEWDLSRTPLSAAAMTAALQSLAFSSTAAEPDVSVTRILAVRVFDGQAWSNTATTHVQIALANDNAPTVAVPLTGTVSEAATVGTVLVSFTTSDADACVSPLATSCSDNEVTVALVAGAASQPYVALNAAGTAVVLSARVDREQIANLSFSLVASDAGTPQLSTTVGPIVIGVTDVNDNFPSVGGNILVLSVPENTTLGAVVGAIDASDADATAAFSTLQFTLDNPTPLSVGSDGTLTLNTALDFETQRLYTLTATASDGEFSDFLFVDVEVENVNDVAPSITPSNDRLTSYVEGSGPSAVDPLLQLADADNLPLAGASVRLSSSAVASGLQCVQQGVGAGSDAGLAPHAHQLRCTEGQHAAQIVAAESLPVSVSAAFIPPVPRDLRFALSMWVNLSTSAASQPQCIFEAAPNTTTTTTSSSTSSQLPLLSLQASSEEATLQYIDTEGRDVRMVFPAVIAVGEWVHVSLVVRGTSALLHVGAATFDAAYVTEDGVLRPPALRSSLSATSHAAAYRAGAPNTAVSCGAFEGGMVGLTLHLGPLSASQRLCLQACGEALSVPEATVTNAGLTYTAVSVPGEGLVLDFVGTASLSAYAAVLSAVTYEHSLHRHPLTEVALTVSVDDGAMTAEETWAVSLVAAPSAPLLFSRAPHGIAFVEGSSAPGTPVSLADAEVGVFDQDSSQLAELAVMLAGTLDGDASEGLVFTGSAPAGLSVDGGLAAWRISGQGGAPAFLDALTALVYVNTAEEPTPGVRSLVFNATDVGGATSDPLHVNITVVVVNDNAPTVALPQQSVVVPENTTVPTVLDSVDLSASDADSGPTTLTYSVAAPASAMFEVVGSQLVLVSPLDFEALPASSKDVHLSISVSDGDFASTLAVRVRVTDAAEPPSIASASSSGDGPVSVTTSAPLSSLLVVDPGQGVDALQTLTVSLPVAASAVPSGAILTTLECRDEARLSSKLSLACSRGGLCTFGTSSLLTGAAYFGGAQFDEAAERVSFGSSASAQYGELPVSESDLLVDPSLELDDVALATWVLQEPGSAGMLVAKSKSDGQHYFAVHSDGASTPESVTLHFSKRGVSDSAVASTRAVFELPSSGGVVVADGEWHFLQVTLTYPTLTLTVDGTRVALTYTLHRPTAQSALVRINGPDLPFRLADAQGAAWVLGARLDSTAGTAQCLSGELGGTSLLRPTAGSAARPASVLNATLVEEGIVRSCPERLTADDVQLADLQASTGVAVGVDRHGPVALSMSFASAVGGGVAGSGSAMQDILSAFTYWSYATFAPRNMTVVAESSSAQDSLDLAFNVNP